MMGFGNLQDVHGVQAADSRLKDVGRFCPLDRSWHVPSGPSPPAPSMDAEASRSGNVYQALQAMILTRARETQGKKTVKP